MKKKSLHIISIAFLLGAFSFVVSLLCELRAQTGYPVIDTTDLVAYYDFYGSFRDSTGNNVSAYPHQAELTENRFCHPQNAVHLTNPDSYLQIDDDTSLDFTDVLSISFWIYLDSVPEAETRIISKSDPEAPSTGSYWISVYPGENAPSGTPWSFSFTDATGTVQTYKSEWGMITEHWIYYTITFNGSTVTMYLADEPVAIFNTEPTTIQPNDHPLWFGNSVGSGFTGKMDDIVLYNRVLEYHEVESISRHPILWPDSERPNIAAYLGDTIELISGDKAPFLQYRFSKGEEVIQEGADSICMVVIQSESDFGEYSCVAYNCMSAHTKYFDVEELLAPSDIIIIDQPYELKVYENAMVTLELILSGNTDLATFLWYQNGSLIEQSARNLTIDNMNVTDTGYYFCEIMDRGSRLFSDSIHVIILFQETYLSVDTSALRAFYAFNGNFSDSTGNTGPAMTYSVVPDTGIFGTPLQAVRFAGADSYLEIPEDQDLDIPDQLTIALSIRVDTIPDRVESILAKPDGGADSIGNYGLFIDPDLHLIFAITAADGTVYKQVSDQTLQPGLWHLVTATYDGSALNSYLDAIPNQPLPAPGLSLKTNDNSLIIGQRGSGDKTFVLDNFMLYQRAMEREEINRFFIQHLPLVHSTPQPQSGCVGETFEFKPDVTSPFLQFTFSRDGVILQDDSTFSFAITITSEEDFGQYQCSVSNGYRTSVLTMDVEPGGLYDNIYIYDVASTEIYASEGDKVNIWFYANETLGGLEYEMYQNGILLPNVFRGIYTIDHATVADTGAYYFVVINGCERIVSDTVYLIMEGQTIVNYEVVGWDWTGNISGSGSSYFSSICTGLDGSFYLLGYYGGGLRVEDVEVFSSVRDDVFIVKYAENGDYQWSKFLTSPFGKGKGDLAVDSDGNVYVTGSYWDSIQIGDTALTTNMIAGSGYMAKFNPLGDLQWIKHLETSRGMSCDNIEIDADNHIYLGGNFSGSLTIGAHEVTGTWGEYTNVMFLARMDTAGSCEWISHAVTDADMDLFGLIDMDLSSSGEVVASGTYTGQADFGNGVVLNTFIEAPFLVKFSKEGVVQWGTTIDTEFGFAEAFDVSVDEQNRIFMTGMYLSDIAFGEFSIGNDGTRMEEIFLARFDPEGVCTALNSYGSQGDGGDFGICYEPASDTAGYLMGMFGDMLIMGQDTLAAGSSSGQGAVSPNMFIARLSDNGEPLVLKSAGVRGNRFFGEILVTEDGRLYFAGLNAGVSVKKVSAGESSSIAFVGYREQGILEPVSPLEVVINEQETICLGDSTQFRSNWYKEAGTYKDTVKSAVEGDTIYILELTTEICSSTEDDLMTGGYMIYPNPANQVISVKSPDQVPFELQMYGMSGNLVIHLRNQAKYEMDVSGYQPGIYILKLIRPGAASIYKILILHL
ncbi:MAG: T9SS type A sorting domain-containing protein [Bacteroidales bacterium]|nr:T9SS type A sorting domain-containing protein [Bacteroidales bacterium]